MAAIYLRGGWLVIDEFVHYYSLVKSARGENSFKVWMKKAQLKYGRQHKKIENLLGK
jgi:hypothetical protein